MIPGPIYVRLCAEKQFNDRRVTLFDRVVQSAKSTPICCVYIGSPIHQHSDNVNNVPYALLHEERFDRSANSQRQTRNPIQRT